MMAAIGPMQSRNSGGSMYIIGLTGGIGSGKSTVSSYLKELGIPVIDGDKLAREAVSPDKGRDTRRRLADFFGSDIFMKDGSLDREALGRLVFRDEKKRIALNQIMHGFIWSETRKQLWELEKKGYPLAVLDMPLLLETAWNLRVEAIWVVYAPADLQIKRVMKRDGLSQEAVQERIAAQMPARNKLNYADVVIENSRSVDDTRQQVREALKQVPGYTLPGDIS